MLISDQNLFSHIMFKERPGEHGGHFWGMLGISAITFHECNFIFEFELELELGLELGLELEHGLEPGVVSKKNQLFQKKPSVVFFLKAINCFFMK